MSLVDSQRLKSKTVTVKDFLDLKLKTEEILVQKPNRASRSTDYLKQLNQDTTKKLEENYGLKVQYRDLKKLTEQQEKDIQQLTYQIQKAEQELVSQKEFKLLLEERTQKANDDAEKIIRDAQLLAE